ncbi:MAG: M28 family peptidase, partial [Bacteroidales bacterium]
MRFQTMLLYPFIGFLMACNGNAAKNQAGSENTIQPQMKIQTPVFDSDSAYHYVAQQMAFGNRIPNTEAHRQTGEWLASELSRHGAEVIVQDAPVKAFDNSTLRAQNIIGQFNPDAKDRILLLAHWDTRPFADYDPNPDNHKKPVPGANDGASGVGVLLEIARLLGKENPGKGVDIMFVD